VADPEFHNGGRTVEGEESGEGAVKFEFLPENDWWVLVHSRITFYVYAKIAQVNGGGRLPAPWIRHCYIRNELCFRVLCLFQLAY